MQRKYLIFLISFASFLVEIIIGQKLFIWLDEAFTLHTTMHGMTEAIRRAIEFEGQPFLYFSTLSLWRELNDSIFFARLFSSICASLSIPLFYVYIKNKSNIKSPILITFLYAFNPMLIWAGLEIRVYALMILISVLLFQVFESTYIKSKGSIKQRVYFVLLSLIAIHTHYYLSFILLINFGYLFFTQRKIAFKYLLDMLVPVLSLSPYVLALSDQVTTHSVFKISSASDFILYWYRYLRAFFIPMPRIFNSNFINLLVFATIGSLIVLGIRRNTKAVRNTFFKTESYITTLILSMLVLSCLLLFSIGQAGISYRHILFMLIPTNIALYILIYKISSKPLLSGVLGVMILLNIGNIYANAPDFGKETDLLKASEYIATQNENGDPVLCYTPEIQLIYSFIDTKNEVYSIPHPIHLNVQYSHPEWFIKDESDISQFFNGFSETQSFWLLDNAVNPLTEELLEKRFNCSLNFDLLESYVQHNYQVVLSQEFNDHYRIRKITKIKQ